MCCGRTSALTLPRISSMIELAQGESDSEFNPRPQFCRAARSTRLDCLPNDQSIPLQLFKCRTKVGGFGCNMAIEPPCKRRSVLLQHFINPVFQGVTFLITEQHPDRCGT